MLEAGFYNMDCMDGMAQFPDKFFELAIVDPPYGIGEDGGKFRGRKGQGLRIFPKKIGIAASQMRSIGPN